VHRPEAGGARDGFSIPHTEQQRDRCLGVPVRTTFDEKMLTKKPKRFSSVTSKRAFASLKKRLKTTGKRSKATMNTTTAMASTSTSVLRSSFRLRNA
jgi:hypothetical protein